MIVYLLLIAAFLFMAFILPLKVTIGMVLLIVVIGFVVKIVARMVTGNDPTLGESLKAVALAVFFNAIISTALAKIAGGPVTGISALVASVIGFLAFALGFAMMLQATMKQSAVIALVSTPIAGVMLYGALKL
nr:hypothetical protein [uncultured Cupriavidus sp.]